MSVVYFLDRNFDVVCNCCGQAKPGCRLIWIDPSTLMLLCPSCFGFVIALLRALEIELTKGGE